MRLSIVSTWSPVLLCCLLLAAGCHLAPDKPAVKPTPNTTWRYLGNYHWDEQELLANGQVAIKKTIRLNDQTDSAVVKDSAALEALFRPLKDADITKPSLSDAYTTDTIANQFQQDTVFIISSKGKQTWPDKLIVEVDANSRIKKAQVSSYTRNLMYEYKQEIYYERQKALRVSTFQKIIFLQPESMEMEARIYPQEKKI